MGGVIQGKWEGFFKERVPWNPLDLPLTRGRFTKLVLLTSNLHAGMYCHHNNNETR